MPHHTPLITTIVVGLGLAFILGAVANRLRMSPLVGYLIAGILIGPFTPGYVADQGLALQLAEIGVILLMFGVGLHFSVADLLSVRAIAVPGALGQIALATLMGLGLALLLGWTVGAGLVFGLALSVASTVVLLRAMQERRLIKSNQGRIAVGWLIVEDLAMVLTLVLLPAIAGFLGGRSDMQTSQVDLGGLANWLNLDTIWGTLAFTVLKLGAFGVVMLVVGRRVIPWMLHYVAHTGSRELFRLSVLATALGVAFGSAELFGVSFALGAFFAGMIMAESQLSHQAAQETLPLRDAFAVLFFVSVGMLFDPSILLREPVAVLVTVLIIVVGKSIAAFLIVRAFRHPLSIALTISASLAQIGEFSFILAGLGISLGLLPEAGRDLILAGALLSILINPLFFYMADRISLRFEERERAGGPARSATDHQVHIAEPVAPPPVPETEFPRTNLRGHTVLVGYGRVGSLVGQALREKGSPFLVIEERQEVVDRLRAEGIEAIHGEAGQPGLLEAVNFAEASYLISAIPSPFEASNLIQTARAANPDLQIIARAHSDAEIEHLYKYGASLVIMGEQEIARGMLSAILGSRFGSGSEPPDEARTRSVSGSSLDAFETAQTEPGNKTEDDMEEKTDPEGSGLPASSRSESPR
ncbi:YbaL family putative K(+) efflux transporter [Microvirga lenta]|uniref:YbaL family putative K(+) efflux transporter n=1 Tax=Microvirga lenta TaxID=2881337 RepID=UPI001D000445|nr:YbaL family putative K(+) efflux transporter [Microvirga lenta]MCB5176457.1 Kef family K(+) transporter [Microvirga lenta]